MSYHCDQHARADCLVCEYGELDETRQERDRWQRAAEGWEESARQLRGQCDALLTVLEEVEPFLGYGANVPALKHRVRQALEAKR